MAFGSTKNLQLDTGLLDLLYRFTWQIIFYKPTPGTGQRDRQKVASKEASRVHPTCAKSNVPIDSSLAHTFKKMHVFSREFVNEQQGSTSSWTEHTAATFLSRDYEIA